MKKVIIIPIKCKNCDPCDVEIICEKKAVFREEKSDKPWIDSYKCSGCLKCKPVCKYQALEELTNPCH